MTRAYCTRCGADRDTNAGRCPAGHRVALDASGYVGRHRARIAMPRLQVLEVLGFSDHGSTATVAGVRQSPPARLPSTPRRTSRPVGRHRYGAPSTPRRNTEITSLSLTSVDTEASENTGVLVERLWEASDDTMAEVEEWHGTAPAAAPDPGKRRWPWVMAAVSLTAAALAVWALPNALQEREQSAVNDVAAAVGMAAAELSQMDHVATTIIDPAADTASLSGMAVDLTRIDTAARDLLDQAVVAQDLGLADAGEIGQAGELALSLERRLSTVLTYRLLIESSLVLPELPATTSADDLGDIARSLSEAITSIRTDVEALPRDELLDAHRSEAIDAVDALEADQASYLSALRDGDTESAAQVAATMRTRLGDIHDSLDRLLGSLTPWVDDTIAGIQSNLSG